MSETSLLKCLKEAVLRPMSWQAGVEVGQKRGGGHKQASEDKQ